MESDKQNVWKKRTNELREEYTYRFIEQLAQRIRKLSKKEIDKLWYRIGWIDGGRDLALGYKALPERILASIKESREKAIQYVENLIIESPTAEVLKNLEIIEKKKKMKEIIKKHKPLEEKKVLNFKKESQVRKFKLKKWVPPKDNPNWSHDHCEICDKEISNLKSKENEAYGDEHNFYWICKSCYKKIFK